MGDISKGRRATMASPDSVLTGTGEGDAGGSKSPPRHPGENPTRRGSLSVRMALASSAQHKTKRPRRGKAATARVEGMPYESGTQMCIDLDGKTLSMSHQALAYRPSLRRGGPMAVAAASRAHGPGLETKRRRAHSSLIAKLGNNATSSTNGTRLQFSIRYERRQETSRAATEGPRAVA